METIQYGFAEPNELPEIIALLRSAELPVSDIEPGKIDFIIATSGNTLVGCVGIERFAAEGLLRSFAVAGDFRSLNIGSALYERLVSFAETTGIRNLHLLTTTARDYFLRKGFISKDRMQAPESIKRTSEFSFLCPSAVYMSLELIPLTINQR